MSVQEARRGFCGSGAPRAPGGVRKLQAREMLTGKAAVAAGRVNCAARRGSTFKQILF